MTLIRLQPRSTTLFENEQKERLLPNANGTGHSSSGQVNMQATLTPTQTRSQDTITRVRTRANAPRAVPVVSDVSNELVGEPIVNGSFPLRGGDTPNIPVAYGFLFIDSNASITAGDIDVSYQDDADVARIDNFDIIVAGLGPHYTSFKVKSVTSIVGQNFVGQTGVDTLMGGPEIPDTIDGCIGTTGREDFGPDGDPSVGNDGDAAYVTTTEITDQKFYVGFKTLSQFGAVSVDSIRVEAYVKQFSGGSGIEMLFRLSDTDSDWILDTHTAALSTEGGAVTQFFSPTFSTNPKTGNPWTVAEIDTIQIGYRFKGDNPTIQKRINFMRLDVAFKGGFVSDARDGTDPAEQVNAYLSVRKNAFVTPSTAEDNANHVISLPQSADKKYQPAMEDLPPEALTVISVDTHVRATYKHGGAENGAAQNDLPCGDGVATGGDESAGRIDGPLEQFNIGGWRMVHSLGTNILGPRFAVGIGDPVSGCGPFNDFPGNNVAWDQMIETTFLSTLNSSSQSITPANVNAMQSGLEMDDPQKAFRISRIYSEIEFRSSPVGGTFYHLVVDDDPELAPNDNDYMQSKHSADKKFGVDFAGIPEVLAVNSVKAIVRAGVETTGSAQGWRIIWRDGIGNGASDVVETIVNNVGFSNFSFARAVSPFTSAPWTREEANRLVVIWEAVGENDFFEKRISGLVVEMDVDLIPDKIDSARNTGSRRLRLLRKPVPFLEVGLPPQFADARALGDVAVNHNAIPRIAATLGFERWDKSLMRVFKKRIGHSTDIVTLTLLDLREFLSTLWVTGQTKTRGQSAEGMAVLTPGVELQFVRPTNDYHVAPTGTLLQELNADEPPTGLDGILIQNGATNRVRNSAFSEGAPNVFTDWNQTIGAGGSIAENLLLPLFEDDVAGNAPRTVELATPTTPSDGTILDQTIQLDRGDAPLSPSGSDYQISIWHKDDDGEPLSVAMLADPPGQPDERFDFNEGNWVSGATPLLWFDLPVRALSTYDRLPGSLMNMQDIPTSPATEVIDVKIHLAARTVAAAKNSVYAVQVDGGTTAGLTGQRYPTNFILTRNGPVVRAGMSFFINNEAQRPIYPTNLRGTFAIEFVPLWDSGELPRHTGVRRYIYGYVVDAFNEDSFFYDSDTESFVFLRKLAGISKTITLFYPQVTRGVPVQVATRWISSLGDLDEVPFSFQFFVNNIASPSDSHVQSFPLVSSKPLYIGSRDGTDGEMIDAVVRKLEIKQLALPQAAIPRLFT